MVGSKSPVRPKLDPIVKIFPSTTASAASLAVGMSVFRAHVSVVESYPDTVFRGVERKVVSLPMISIVPPTAAQARCSVRSKIR
jgi:hypothetical protein